MVPGRYCNILDNIEMAVSSAWMLADREVVVVAVYGIVNRDQTQ